MSDGLSIGWSNARQSEAVRTYKTALRINLVLHLLVGLACLFLPDWVAHVLGLPEPHPSGWTRGWGATLILVTALYLPGLREPVQARLPNIIGLVGRLWMGTVWLFCGGGFLWLAAFDYIWAVILGLLYLRLFRATIMSRP